MVCWRVLQTIHSLWGRKSGLGYTWINSTVPMILFRKALMGIQSSYDNSSLTNIAWSCGYYDLAHMASDFRDICGYSPSELIYQGQELTETFGQKFSGLMKKKIKIENLI